MFFKPLLHILNLQYKRVSSSTQVVFGYFKALNVHWLAFLLPWIRADIIHTVELDLPFKDEPPFFHIAIRLKAPKGKTDGNLIDAPYCRGRGKTYDEAMTRAFGEVVERYPFTLYREARLPKYTLQECQEKGLEFLDIRKLDIYPEFERTKRHVEEYERDKKITWVWGKKIVSNQTTVNALIPAHFVYWNYSSEKGDGLVLKERSTHGGASYPSLAGALNRALLEWIGRDGFFYHWGLATTPDRIDLTSLKSHGPKRLRLLVEETEQLGYSMDFLDVTSPKVPVPSIACVLRDKKEGAICKTSVGAGCGFDLSEACYDALSEAWGLHQFLCTFFPNSRMFEKKPTEQWEDYERLTYFASGEGENALTFFTAGRLQEFDEIERKYTAGKMTSERDVSKRILALASRHPNIEMYYALPEQNPFFKETGIYSVRTFVSGLIPPYQQMRNIPMESLRGRRNGIINTFPHPYP